MFKIRSLSIYSNGNETKKIPFGDITYIYGSNKKGKTLILRLIDFVLSSSDNLLASGAQGLENVDSASLEVLTDNGTITLFRNIENKFGYKIGNGVFVQVENNEYNRFISSFLYNPSNSTISGYKKVFGEQLSFRALCFINYLEESGIGNLARVFTGTSHIKNFFRAPEIFQFAFEQEKMKKIAELEIRLEKKESELNNQNKKTVELEFYVSNLKSLLRKYNIPFSDDMETNIKRIDELKNTFYSATKPSDSDLNYLLHKSNEISNQIRAQQELEVQSSKIIDRIDAFRILANSIRMIFKESKYATEYLYEIDKIIKDDNESKAILSLKDYSATIKSLKKLKKEYDEKIDMIKGNLSDRSIEEKMIDTTIMFDFCKKIMSQPKINDSKIIESEIDAIKKDIKDLKKDIRNAFDILNDNITKKYLSIDNNKLVAEELNKRKFKIVFDYKTISSYGTYLDNDNKTHSFLPGSSAKMTFWQLCIYLETIKYFRRNLPDMPLLNLFVADGINQPFDDNLNKENYLIALKSIIESSKDFGLQAIIISTDTNDDIERTIKDVGVFYSIGDGLNPLHNY